MTPFDITQGDWRLFSHDAHSGVTRWFLDLGNGQMIVRTDTPVDDLISDNAEAYSNSLSQNWGDGQRVASIPLDVYFSQLAEARKNGDRKYIKKWLNDSDNRKFRTFKGTV
ncbi:hypothetical protein [Mesorhizobium sp. Pch-S]|uniref:hypothetical protein n=1 Tax=Mesorhizobium sp. Pch-S TaxID=2082387 RepID=UPI001012D3FB|nr:hypothetical protein [Mesorhizobium sp. Pch-S]